MLENELLTGFEDMSEKDPSEHILLAIIGGPGEGKSWLASSCVTEDEPALVWDFDGRAQSIAGKKYILVKTLKDINYPSVMPSAWSIFTNDLSNLEALKAMDKLKYKWFIYDSATYGSVAALNYVMYHNNSLRRQISAGAGVAYIPKSFDTYKAEMSEVIGAWGRLAELGNLIVVFHAGPERAPDYSPENQKFTGRVVVEPPRYVDTLALFNEQWRVKAIQDKLYEVQTRPNGEFTGKTALKIDLTETPNIRSILKKHRSQ